ncbi:hypothetical protein PCANC_14547 [Puccinia coronata f. sp. avenae]|uniref:Uncharacterized protein n=1 Tax=Puccinia coronata f. sp. avenae TaxID=200324 RepID=A0A2N5UJW9_9BASI|nr:hypothetical protein PCANC_14547 [Puccinia coronata f. sp. avenae]
MAMIGRGKHGSTKAISALPLITLACSFDHLEYCDYNTGYTSGCGGYVILDDDAGQYRPLDDIQWITG